MALAQIKKRNALIHHEKYSGECAIKARRKSKRRFGTGPFAAHRRATVRALNVLEQEGFLRRAEASIGLPVDANPDQDFWSRRAIFKRPMHAWTALNGAQMIAFDEALCARDDAPSFIARTVGIFPQHRAHRGE